MDQSTDYEVISQAVDWLQQGTAIALVTVVNTWGSAPRRPGALMVIHADGRFSGSVSGGCIEDDLVQRMLRGEFEQQAPQLLEYGIDSANAQRLGLPCGGRLELVVEYIDTPVQLHSVLDSMAARRCISRRVCLNTGESSLHAATHNDSFVFDGDTLYKLFGPTWRLLIIGAGELSRRVAQLALTLDYAVTICDSRPEYASGWEVEGTDFNTRPPAEMIAQFEPDHACAVLALAHTPVLEDEVLATALTGEAFYIGALGSNRNQQARLGRLRKRGLNDTHLARLHGPVGIDIGSHTPAEIAIAITAALIQARNRQLRLARTAEVQHG